MPEQKRPFLEMEEEILKYWEENEIFKKTLEKNQGKGPAFAKASVGREFVFYEGPPTANGKPGIHHLEARAFKDVIPRYKTMRGYHVRRKGGWDTHGLPVEIEVEKELGLKSKRHVEAYGIEKFNAKCKESVWKYLEDWKRFTHRIGYWVDLEHPYITYEPKYIESLWAVVKKIWDDGRLYKDYKVLPWCPRCGTALSSHELAQGYKDVKELSVTAKFKVKNPAKYRLPENTFLLAWTTTPWTLPGNVGLAIGSAISYSTFRTKGSKDVFIAAAELVEKITSGGDVEMIARMGGSDLVGLEYEPLYPFMQNLVIGEEKVKLDEKAYRVYAADFVTTAEGTGIVHMAIMYGIDDFVLGTAVGLPKHHLVNLDGTFVEGMDFLSGRFVKEEGLDVDIIKDLAHRGLLFSKAKYAHSYPHCWRCKTPLIYYARDSWYIRMSDLREEMIAQNKEINWEPSHLRDGRFGEWLDGVKDWAISRERYWATPLPIWESKEADRICVGSFEELRSLAKDPGLIDDNFDPHRPFVDDVVLVKDGKEFVRVKEVMDVWFDSGAMPFAQDHYPFSAKDGSTSGEENKDPIGGYPADYISEAIDQTRGWFYTLHAVGALMGRGKAYKNVISLGHILDAEGKKMSKSVGNVVDPWEMMEKYGVDALRWWMYTVNQPGESKNFEEKSVDEIVKKVFMILWNVKSFYELYASPLLSCPSKPEGRSGVKEGQGVVSEHVLDCWILARLDELVMNTTQWLDGYRVLEPARAIGEFVTDLSQWYVRRSRDRFKTEGEDKKAAISTLRHVLIELSKLMAPFTPFIAEKMYRDLGGEKESVHLEEWPRVIPSEVEGSSVIEDMKLAREIVTMALEKRSAAKIPVRQALASLTVVMEGELSNELKQIIADEVNVKDILVSQLPAPSSQLSVELDTALTPELLQEGIAREIIRRVNDLRKKAGLTIEDRIMIHVLPELADGVIGKALERHERDVLDATRADAIAFDEAEGMELFAIGEETVRLAVSRV